MENRPLLRSWPVLTLAALATVGVASAAPPPDPAGPGSRRIESVAGTGQRGYSGDGGSARSAMLYEPSHVSVDGAGSVYVADTLNNRIRRIDASGVVNTIAGTGAPGFGGDGGPATAAAVAWPHGTAVDPGGTVLYVADSANHRVRRVDLASGVISTVAGTGTPGPAGDGGPATGRPAERPQGGRRGPRRRPVDRRHGQRPGAPGGRRRSDHHRGRHGNGRLLRRRRPGHGGRPRRAPRPGLRSLRRRVHRRRQQRPDPPRRRRRGHHHRGRRRADRRHR